MSTDLLRHHPEPLILLASPDPWLAQGLRGPLSTAGFRVITTHAEPETLERVHSRRPHAIVLDVAIAPPGFGLCRTLRSASLATPIVLVCQGHPSRDDVLEAVRAGAWDFRGTPLDVEDLVLRVVAYVEPKLELDRVSEECLVDRVSGLYNHLGLAKRADELAALATRHGLALACMVFRPGSSDLPSRAASDRLAVTFKSVGRASDAVGRTGRAEFAVFAAAGNAWAAKRLVHRLTDRATGYGNGFDVRAGYSAAAPSQKISSYTLLARARSALESGLTPG
ncbi:MAG TPA: response regulator [Gemmatimonadales bacterium]|nr:response regulator [Gemmatimonadales bacterium]